MKVELNDVDPRELERFAQALKDELARDDIDRKSIFTRIREAVASKDYPLVSDLQLEMGHTMGKLKELYRAYRRNILAG